MEGKEPEHPTMLRENKTGDLEYNRHREIAVTNLFSVQYGSELEKAIRTAQANDKWCRTAYTLCKEGKSPENLTIDKDWDLLLFKGKVYLPHSKLRLEIVRDLHGAVTHGHPGVSKTTEHLTRHYYFPNMRKTVEKVIAECECARNKSARHAPYGMMKSPSTPEQAWESIAWDFIVKLPQSKEPMTGTKYDAILVIVDRLTKYAYFIPYQEASTAEDLAYTFLRTVVSQHGLLKEIISDRDKLFMLKFW